MLCSECGGDGWKTMADSHGVVTMICHSCGGTGVAHPESETAPTEEIFHEDFWEALQLSAHRSYHDFVSRRDYRI